MNRSFRLQHLILAALALMLVACATRPINGRIDHPNVSGSEFFSAPVAEKTMVVMAFSGGGTRAAAFSYGALEALKETTIQKKDGSTKRLLDYVDAISSVSGGSFTALAYRLYGDQLFEIYEQDFLKRDIQGQLFSTGLNPTNWGNLMSYSWWRSEMAADLYDQVLFKGATFADLAKTKGPLIIPSSTDLQTGTRILFTKEDFDFMCADLDSFRVARAASASSSVPILLAPLTLNNYAGTCGYTYPSWLSQFKDTPSRPRAVSRALARQKELERLDSKNSPYLHLADGALSDNLGLRSVIDAMNALEAHRDAGGTNRLDGVENIVIIVVNSLTEPTLNWNRQEQGPGFLAQAVQSFGVSVDHNSEAQLTEIQDIANNWAQSDQIKATREFKRLMKNHPNMDAATAIDRTPAAKISLVYVAFSELPDPDERDYLNNLPTTFTLTSEQVDRLRSAAKQILSNSESFNTVVQNLNKQ